MRRIITSLCMLCLTCGLSAQLLKPNDFIPVPRGEHFTPHHMIVDYFEYVAENSARVQLVHYGETYEKRPLILAIVSSESNMRRIEAIRENNLKLAGLMDGAANDELNKAIVWLSYSVHGNEASGSEASPEVLYALADPNNERSQRWLENTVVILDPCLNPDGYSRYSHWIRGVGGMSANADPNDIEHNEPWPGGRVNHYLFDLNRDWAWQTQTESKQRAVEYHKWMPHVHADIHEMYPNEPYYFAPAAEPYHKYISQWQRDFQVDIGKNHAKYFDKNGWLYFTRETFDLFYPSYGDTYPTFNGAIGMTYEQAGHSRGGRALELENEQILTLSDRIEHHFTTSLSTIEVSSVHADALVREFAAYFRRSSETPQGPYKTYVVKAGHRSDDLKALCQLLDKQHIRYGTVSRSTSSNGFDYQQLHETSFSIDPGDLVISAYQPRSVMVQALLDPESELADSLTYDITAWALPHAYGLQAFATTRRHKVDNTLDFSTSHVVLDKAYAYILEWNTASHVRVLAQLLSSGVKVRCAEADFDMGDRTFARGSMVITAADNAGIDPALHEILNSISAAEGVSLTPVHTGFTDRGPNFGSEKMRLLKRPSVLLLTGSGINANAFGQVRYYFEQEIGYPLTVYQKSALSGLDLGKYNVLILPDGWYRFSDGELKSITDWVRRGGKLVCISNAVRNLIDREGLALRHFESEEAEQRSTRAGEQAALANRELPFEGQDRRNISRQNQGAVVRTHVDNSHPLAYGLQGQYFSLKTNNLYYPLMKNASNVVYADEEPEVLGFMGAKAQEQLSGSLTFGTQRLGRGHVVYLIDNPLFRAFWKRGHFVFSNALFVVGN